VSPERRLAAIMFTDIVGYTALMAESEQLGRRVRERHVAAVQPLVERYNGRWIEQTGDETLSTFESAVDAVNCALAIQEMLRDDQELRVRVGVHLGEVSFEDGRVIGDGVNVASRVRPLAEPGGVAISDEVQHSVQNQENLETRSLGPQQLKNVSRPVEVFAVSGRAEAPRRLPGPTPVPSSRRFPLAGFGVAALVVLAAGIAWLIATIGPDPHPAPIRSIAVLPLENLSGDPEQEYFADGMTNELISELVRIRSVRVPSWTTVRTYKDANKPLPDIADELDVDFVVEGTILRNGDRLRITLQLIDARKDAHLWAESYERGQREVPELKALVAIAVARTLSAELTGERVGMRRRPVHPEAHEAYMRGRLHLSETTIPDTFKAIEYFERAIELDPDYAPAHSGLAGAYIELTFGHAHLRPRDAMPRARAAAEKAIELDPMLGRAHTHLAGVLGYYEWRWDEAEAEYKRGAELSPSDARAVDMVGDYLATLGRYKEALVWLERAVELGSLELVVRQDYASALFRSRAFGPAAEEHRKILELDPDFPWSRIGLAWAYQFQGDREQAYRELTVWQGLVGRDEAWLRGWKKAHEEGGLDGAYRFWLQQERARAEVEYADPSGLAMLSSVVNDRDETLRWLEQAYEERPPLFPFFLHGWPPYDSLRSDPRFQDLLRRIGFPES
jgi:TolB-like protein/class 3 adenylate cyclase/tetratricopeptide (TPR) repeat protein